MRISSNPSDAAYSPEFHRCRVWLAGAERNNVETADEAGRFAVTLARDEHGRPVLDKAGSQVRQKFYGDVRIDCPAWLRISQEHHPNEEGLGALGAAIQNWSATP